MDLPTYNFKVTKTEEEWKVLGKELSTFFDKNLYFLYWKYPIIKIQRAFHIAQKNGDKDVSHLIQNIKS